MLVQGLPLDHLNTEAHLGWVKALAECRIQFDVVETDAAWERYALLVLPEELAVDEALAARLEKYAAQGGALLVSHTAGLVAGTKRSWLEKFGLAFDGLSEFKPAYLVPQENFTGDIPAYEYALYEGASRWRASGAAKVVARLGEPLFQRGPAHYTSHQQTPFDHLTEYAAAAVSGRVALAAFPLGASYYAQGYWVYRALLRHLLKQVLPEPLITTDAPLSTEITVTWQDAPRPRYLVHVVNWSANRGTPRHPVFHEEPVTLAGVTVRLNLPLPGTRVKAVVSGLELTGRRAGTGLEVSVPPVKVHEILEFEA